MQNLGSPDRRIFWCGRCGTLKEYTGDFERVELPGWLRQTVATAGLAPGRPHQSQHLTVDATIKIDQHDETRPRLDFRVFDAAGRRVV